MENQNEELSGSLSDSASPLPQSATQRLSGSLSDSAARRLSFLMDGELGAADASHLLASMSGDNELCSTWRRYHLIRQGLRGEPAVLADEAFAARVVQAVAAEPVFFQPRNRLEWLKPAGGLALAAAISALAVLGMRGDRSDGSGFLPYAPDNWVASGGIGEVQQAGNSLLSPEKLNAYLVMHNEGVYLAGASDMLPQSRVVSIVNP